MKKHLRIFCILFWLMIVAVCIGSMSLSLIPFVLKSPAILYLIGGAFWFFHLLAYVLLIAVSQMRERIASKRKSRRRTHASIGLFTAFRTKVGTIFDILTLVSIALLVIFGLLNRDYEWWYYLLISTALLSFQLRGMFNGKNYRNLIQFKKERQHEKV